MALIAGSNDKLNGRGVAREMSGYVIPPLVIWRLIISGSTGDQRLPSWSYLPTKVAVQSQRVKVMMVLDRSFTAARKAVQRYTPSVPTPSPMGLTGASSC